MNWLQNGAGFVFMLAQDQKVEASFMMKIVENSIWVGIGSLCACWGVLRLSAVSQDQAEIIPGRGS